MKTLMLFLREIRIEHTLFALPFAYVGALLASEGHLTIAQLCWITLAVLGARTTAMAANRLIDRQIDARNPRTAQRATARGDLSPRDLITAILLSLLLTLIAAIALNPLCVVLLPIAAAALFLYPYCKRFTWATHFVLGAIDGCAPLGASIAVSGTIGDIGLLLFAAVTLWVAGFDIIYALMDVAIDREQRLWSIPAIFSTPDARRIALILHGLMTTLLALAGHRAHAGHSYIVGLAAAVVLVLYEAYHLAREQDPVRLNERIFRANMLFSVVFLAATATALR